MKCIQFTDLHIGLAGQDTRGVDVRENLRKTLAAIAEERADQVVLTGDLCFKEPRNEIYHWIKEQCVEFGIQPIVIAGNHDDQSMMQSVLGASVRNTGEIYFNAVWEGVQVLFLDTAVARMSTDQWNWLNEKCEDVKDRLVIFMHHPPAICGVPYMDDKHRFQEPQRLQHFIESVKVPVHVYCGHYHIDRMTSIGNMHIYITPSCFFQINQENPEFEVDHYRIGYRRIELTQESISSTVVYLD